MSLSQRIYNETKHRLDRMQARVLIDKIREKRIPLPEFIELIVKFAEEHFDDFVKRVQDEALQKKSKEQALPEFIRLMDEIDAPGSPDDYKEYDYEDL
jgi:hypothetical protein